MTDTIHATAVALDGRAVLLLGPSGAGKSDLALRLIDRGWRLVADDRVVLTVTAGQLVASAPPRLAGLIEVRDVGICAEAPVSAPVALAVDLAGQPDRLPDVAMRSWHGIAIPLLALGRAGDSLPLKVERALRAHGRTVEAGSVIDSPPPLPTAAPPMLIVSGMSGAGKSSALKALEDLGYEAVDNLPLGLVETLFNSAEGGDGPPRPLAFGIDTRTRAFDAEALVERLRALRGEGVDIRLLYLDCADDELTRRFSETRRRHPLAADRPAADGIGRERTLTAPLRRWADLVIDTTELSVADLRRRIAERLGRSADGGLTVTLMSFGFAQGLPRDADLVFDMRFLANPHWDVALRPLTGEDAAVAAYVAADAAYAPAIDRIADLLLTLLPGYGREGKAYLTIAIGCTGGRHRSVAVARELQARLAAAGHAPALVHRDMASHGNDAAILTAPPTSGEAGAT
ncbi:MAG: RNase adaptor protein RapZ [Alphaproteobacteria bacterium PA4]|nr:MAG: RNase adaptor protein RapZ [Alphaproteobacteria bacterium PA4]